MPSPSVPQLCPTARELDDLELLSIGALAPIQAFDEPGSPVTLTLPDEIAASATEAGAVELVDPEGLPLARVSVPGGAVAPLTRAQFGPFRDHYLTPAQVRETYVGRTFVPVTDALTDADLDSLAPSGPLVLLALVGDGTPELSPVGLIRATLAASRHLDDAVVVAVPLASHGDPQVDHDLGVQVVSNYAGPDPVVAIADRPVGRAARSASDQPAGRAARSASDEASRDPATDAPTYPDDIAAVVDFERPAPDEQGLVLFFTGLSGSGKSTLARALMDRLLEQGSRTVTSLDGDVVRRNLSAGLTFSKEDRETNIRRIGWVAAEISRHGGVAVCSPIAPFDATRQDVRQMVEAAGGAFFLVHVATPLEECERRDRKGLYAKARRGEIPEFTGISSPYEEPDDADVRVDTTGRTIDDALDDVLEALRDSGYLDLPPVGRAARSASDDAPVGRAARSASDDASRDPATEGRAPTTAANALGEATDIEPVPVPVQSADPLRVLFVCTANICRSPFMQHLATRLAGDAGVEFTSAGTHGFLDHPMDEVMVQTLTERELVADTFRSRKLSRELVEDADLILTAEATHRAFILEEHPAAVRKVFTLGQFAQALTRVEGGVSGADLVAAVATRRGAADPALDVADPYARGPEAAERCASQIEDLLRVVVPSLTGSPRITA